MKKFLILAVLSLGMMSQTAKADVPPSASTDVYDISNYGSGLLDLFYEALQQGRKYPTQAEFEAAGFNMMDMAFVRSHVRPRSIMVDHSKDINQNVQENRQLWMNVPIGIGKVQGGYPSSNFNDDTYSSWNYTKVFGNWNHGIFHVPGVVMDCAHKNGTDAYGGVKFFESWTPGSDSGNWVSVLQTKDANGYEGFKYVEPFINALMFFGQDGLNYNWEASGYDNADVIKFHQACYKLAAERGFDNFHIGIYTAIATLTNSCVEALFGKNKVKTADAFLNYSASDFAGTSNIRTSVNTAENAMGTVDGVYQGAWIVSMARSWSNLSANASCKKMGIVLWGEHNQSRVMSWNEGNSGIDFQEKYQKLQERMMSGGYRNPATRPTATNSADWVTADESTTGLRNFQGLAEYIPERTAINQNLPFITYFNIGNGDRYNYKGKKTHGSWYNLGQQDVVPTYRWLVYKSGTQVAQKEGIPEFTNADAYIGGSCVRLTGTVAQDIELYRTKLTCSAGNPVARLALKCPEGATAGTVSVIVKLEGSDTWVETKMGSLNSHNWEEKTASLNGVSKGSVIEYVGLRTSGNVNGMLVGELALDDDIRVTPANIKEAVVEVKEETKVSLSVKLRWDVDAVATTHADYGLVYNDDANIDHFEVFYKDGENGAVKEVARTTSWGAYVGNIPMETSTNPIVGVRAASIDGKSYSDVVWVAVPRSDSPELPETSPSNDIYPTIQLNDGSEGLQNALTQRYVTEFTTTGATDNLNYTNYAGTPYTQDINNGVSADNADKTNYILADKTLKVAQGQTVTCTMKYASNSDGLQYCTLRGYCDWDGDHAFDATNDELVLKVGESNAKKENTDLTNPYTFTIKVPSDAATGANRLRLVFSDAWFPHPGSAGSTSKGFAIDFPMEITGTNAARQPAVDTHDQGEAENPLTGIHGVTVEKGGVSKARFENGEIRLDNCDKVWVVNSEGRLVKYVNGKVDALNTTGYAPGVYLVRMQSGNVQRTTKVIVK